jgi:hypothetical protein
MRSPFYRLSVIAAGLAGLGLLLAVSAAHAQTSKPGEYQVKAAYLYNFTKFVKWPTDAPSVAAPRFSICVLGRDPFGPVLDSAIMGEVVDGKSVIARRIAGPMEAEECGIVFISSMEAGRLDAILAQIGKHSVLTVSDIPQFAQHGGMVQFVVEANKVRFEVNLPAAENNGLVLSSDLLKVAVRVRREE